MPQNRKPIWILLIVGFLLYLPALFNGFVWDDEELIVNNAQIQSLVNLPAFFSGSTFNSGGGGNLAGLYYKPLMTTTFAIIYSIFGLNPFFFHLFQVVIHVANVLLLYLVLCHIFDRFKLDSRLALLTALFFLIHPINAEAVVYLADYQEILFFFFGVLAFWLILTRKRIFWPSLLILLSLLSKETGSVFATIIFIYLFLFEKQKIKHYVSGVAVSLGIYSFLRFAVAGIFFNKHGLTEISLMSLPQRIVNIPEIISTYLKNFFWPADLAINQQWVVKTINRQPLVTDIIFLSGLGLLGYTIWKKKRDIFPLWFFFLAWFLLGLGFHLQFFPLDLTVSDRWFYLPIVGLLAMLVLAGSLIKFRDWIVYGLIIVLVLLSGRTWIREFDWHDGLTLYSHDINVSRNAFDLENNLGVELFRIGKFEEAKVHFEKSTQLSPQWWTNWNNLGAVYEREGDATTAARLYRRSIDNGQYYLAYENYAAILVMLGRKDEAKTFLEKEALPRLPYNQRLRLIYDYLKQ